MTSTSENAQVLAAGLVMAAIALVGSVGLLLPPAFLETALPFIVAFAAGTLLGGGLFHLIPHAAEHVFEEASAAGESPELLGTFGVVFAGFAVCFALEQYIHWFQHRRLRRPSGPRELGLAKDFAAPELSGESPAVSCSDLSPAALEEGGSPSIDAAPRHPSAHADCCSEVRPVGPMILFADGLHNALGGLAVGAAFAVSMAAGWQVWLASVLHEVPQEIADFGVLVYAGLSPRRALLLNFLSALTFPVACEIAFALAASVNTAPLMAFGAGNFIFLAAAELVPEMNRLAGDTARSRIASLLVFLLGAAFMVAIAEH
jgi:zinc and cadmium transporter